MRDRDDEERDAEVVAGLTAIQLPLLVYVKSLVPGDPAVRDVAQQANGTIWEKRHDFEAGTNFRAWAFSIARFEVLNYRKRQARDRLVFSAELEETMAAELAESPDDAADRLDALNACMSELRPQDRELLTARYAGGGTLAEYAARIGRSVGGLKVALHRLRSTLMSCIEFRLRGDGGATA